MQVGLLKQILIKINNKLGELSPKSLKTSISLLEKDKLTEHRKKRILVVLRDYVVPDLVKLEHSYSDSYFFEEKGLDKLLKNLVSLVEDVSKESIIYYEGQYPEQIPEFSFPDESLVQVSQQGVDFCPKRGSIFSWGFSKCWALLLRERESGKVALAHVQQAISEKQYFFLRDFGNWVEDPRKEAIVVLGSLSNIEDKYLKKFSFKYRIIKVYTGRKGWDLAYREKENKILINQKIKNRILIYNGF